LFLHLPLALSRAGKNGRKEQIEQCSQQCQAPYQRAAAVTQQEIGNFQNRLSRALMQCNDDAQSMVTPEMQNETKQMKRVEDSLLKCMEGVIHNGRESLKPMKKRVESQIV
jgi:exonuclease VII large subunit